MLHAGNGARPSTLCEVSKCCADNSKLLHLLPLQQQEITGLHHSNKQQHQKQQQQADDYVARIEAELKSTEQVRGSCCGSDVLPADSTDLMLLYLLLLLHLLRLVHLVLLLVLVLLHLHLLQQSARLLRRLESDLASSAQRHNETKRENMLLKQRICELQGATVTCQYTLNPRGLTA